MQAFEGDGTVQLSWFWRAAPPAGVEVRRRCGDKGVWTSLTGTIPLGLDSAKDLGYLPQAFREKARTALAQAIEGKNFHGHMDGRALSSLWKEKNGPALAALLFGGKPSLAQYAGLAAVDSAPMPGCRYGLFASGKGPLATAVAFRPKVELRACGLEATPFEEVRLCWSHRLSQGTPGGLVRYDGALLLPDGTRRPLFADILDGSGSDSIAWPVPRDSLAGKGRLRRFLVTASVAGAGTVGSLEFTAPLPLSEDESRSLSVRPKASLAGPETISWSFEHAFGDSIPVDSTVLEMDEGETPRHLRSLVGLVDHGELPVEAWMRGEDGAPAFRYLRVRVHSPLGTWISLASLQVPAKEQATAPSPAE